MALIDAWDSKLRRLQQRCRDLLRLAAQQGSFVDTTSRSRAEQHNRLLRSLSDSDFALLQPHLEAVPLELRERLEDAHRPVRDAYFIDGGLSSVVAVTARGRQQA